MSAEQGTNKGLHEGLFMRALESIYARVEPEQAFHKFIDQCSEALPSPAWESYRLLDIPRDLRHLENWLLCLFESEPPPLEINGLYFGISDPFLGIGYELYVAGSSRYDPSDVFFDWAADQDYYPESRYSESEVFHSLWKPAELRQLPYQLADDAVPLVYAGLVVGWLMRRMPRVVLGRTSSRAVAVGHDEGDVYLLGIVNPDGYHESNLGATLKVMVERRRRHLNSIDGISDA